MVSALFAQGLEFNNTVDKDTIHMSFFIDGKMVSDDKVKFYFDTEAGRVVAQNVGKNKYDFLKIKTYDTVGVIILHGKYLIQIMDLPTPKLNCLHVYIETRSVNNDDVKTVREILQKPKGEIGYVKFCDGTLKAIND